MKVGELVKMLLAACLAVIATGAGAWMVFGQDKVSRAEMSTYVHEQLRLPEARIGENEEDLEALGSSVKELVTSQQELVVEIRVLAAELKKD